MFQNCTNLVHVNLANWTINGTATLTNMFKGCTKLETIDMSGWNVNTFTSPSSQANSFVNGCTALKRIILTDANNATRTFALQDAKYAFNNNSLTIDANGIINIR